MAKLASQLREEDAECLPIQIANMPHLFVIDVTENGWSILFLRVKSYAWEACIARPCHGGWSQGCFYFSHFLNHPRHPDLDSSRYMPQCIFTQGPNPSVSIYTRIWGVRVNGDLDYLCSECCPFLSLVISFPLHICPSCKKAHETKTIPCVLYWEVYVLWRA